MRTVSKLDHIINIDDDKCFGCHACITECPIKFCMDASREKITINEELCIGCGHCVVMCTHDARHVADNLERLQGDLKRGDKVIAIVAPAVLSVFPGNYLRLNGFLKAQGIEAIFDVSFGAEITALSYVNYIKEKKPRLVIAQPCPAIVNYIEIYHPELLPYLAPIDSPMLHTMKMIREYYPQYRGHKIAVISPCIAKQREFTETGMGDYNVTMTHMEEVFNQDHVDLGSYPSVPYDGPKAERATMFPIPGGLTDVLERFLPGIRRNTRKIESPAMVYHYLSELAKDVANPDIDLPFLVDCLNCEDGCVGGTGTGNHHKTMDAIESPVRKRSKELELELSPRQNPRHLKKYNDSLKAYWKPGLYHRSYHDRSASNNVKPPSEAELWDVFRRLRKETQKDLFDCRGCGYRSCKDFAIAVFNNLNRLENCTHYNMALLKDEKKTTVYINQQLKVHISRALELIEAITSLIERLNVTINMQSEAVGESSEVTGHVVNSLKETSELSRKRREAVVELIENATKGQEAMRETILSVKKISESVDGIASTIKIISVIASNTNLLSMNAAIEAAHAGDAGQGFAVVADEIRRLSESTRENSRGISQTLSNIIASINATSKRTGDTGNLINEMSDEINGFANTMTELIDTLSELSAKSSRVTDSLQNLQEHSSNVKTDYTEILSLIDKLRYDINFLAAMSADIVKAIEEGDQEIISRLAALDSAQG